ncbi:hypothetical protein QBC37DRAFT_401885 [Rhypophila decipiens]|uniref:Uncharacterized protein n=1 Tax=Rhypophila decipiens TaxID=261697 RepID=A0AAN7B8K0_9PEZI|nr:hypothetical protein QBC37DRAFT_401885 [Rhypophila decipiens]
MKFLHLLSTIVSTAAAVDVRFFKAYDCGSATYVTCYGLNPNTCCGAGTANEYGNIGFYGIQYAWDIDYRAHYASSARPSSCGELRRSERHLGTNFVCLNSDLWLGASGAGYSFRPHNKRETVADADAADIGNNISYESCQRADTLVLDDGASYNLTSLNDTAFNDLLSSVGGATTAVNISAEFDDIKIE